MSEIVVPRLSYDDLRQRADLFLNEFHPPKTLPVPIEEIIEFSMRLDIVPMPGLQATLEYDGFEVDGYTSSNMKEITVDEFVYKNRYNRYRFTLTHEVGHITLHRDLYMPRRFNTIEGWKAFICDFPKESRGWFEWQAHTFAGLVLVPSDKLAEVIDRHLNDVVQAAQRNGESFKKNPDFCWDITEDLAAKDFEVSTSVIHIRVEKDNLKERYAHIFI